MSGVDEKNSKVNFVHVMEEKTEKMKSVLFNLVEKQKNFYRLNTIVSSECAKRCLTDLKHNRLNSDETICFTACTEKFYNALDLGENIYDRLSNKEVSTTPLLKGDFKTVAKNL